jgi:transcriptional regulator
MYIPPAFQGPDQPRLFDFIEAHSFGLVVSAFDGQLRATHLPLLVRRDVGLHGQLVGHMARANPLWREMAGRDVLTIFSGPHAYVSPSWYEADNVVPTWNYVAVHVHGRCQLVDDEQLTADILTEYVNTYERSMTKPWKVDLGTAFSLQLIKQIVAFHIDVEKLAGKWKLSQNHPAERREKVARQLARSADSPAREIARLMGESPSAPDVR